MGTRKSRHNKGRKPRYKDFRTGVLADELRERQSEVRTASAPAIPPPVAVKAPALIYPSRVHKLPYHRPATGNVITAGFNYLSDLIIRPGIEKKLWPLLLYRGAMSPGHAHRLWNMTLLMMASEAPTLADGLKIANNPVFNQLCGPPKIPTKITLRSFFGRLWDNPDTTELIPGLTDYVRSLELGRSGLIPVDLETHSARCAEWRVSLHPEPKKAWEFKKERGAPQLFYPYLVHDVSKPTEGADLVKLVNQVVPSTIPEQWRADICQEMIVGLLSGDIKKDNINEHVAKYVSGQFAANPILYEHHMRRFSLDAPLRGDDENHRSLNDLLHDGSYEHWSDAQADGSDEDVYQEEWVKADRQIAAKEYRHEVMEERTRYVAPMNRRLNLPSQIDDIFELQVRDKQAEMQAMGHVMCREEIIELLEMEDE